MDFLKPSELPRVSCLMVTANRKNLAKRAVSCFQNQTYPNKELVVIDDGNEDYTTIFEGIPASDIKYIRLKKSADAVLGTLRNRALDEAEGDYLIQWDDDDWYHPERIAIQAKKLSEGYDACCLSSSLMHLSEKEHLKLPFIGRLPDGIPGSIMHVKNNSIRYPEYRKAEDTVYLKEWKKLKYCKLPDEFSYLFIRCYHGNNTWEVDHFKRRIKNSPLKWIIFMWYKFIVRDLSKHPKYKMTGNNKDTFEQYIAESNELGLF
jgi:glycosyltransferase involved in cell wall biosynthesis